MSRKGYLSRAVIVRGSLIITRRCYREGNACVGAECLRLTSDLREKTDKRVSPSYTDLASVTGVDELTVTCEVDALEQSFRLRALFEGTAFLTMY